MSERPKDFEGEDRQTDALAPEVDNSEQDDSGEQAQTVTDDALRRATGVFGLEESEKVPTGEDTDDAQDLVDHMEQMDSSGRIDMDAYRGEDNHDDNVDKYGRGAKIDDLPGDGSDGR